MVALTFTSKKMQVVLTWGTLTVGWNHSARAVVSVQCHALCIGRQHLCSIHYVVWKPECSFGCFFLLRNQPLFIVHSDCLCRSYITVERGKNGLDEFVVVLLHCYIFQSLISHYEMASK
jgi:hypothetical protein